MGATSNVPENLRYTKDHEWVKLEGDRATVGITDYAQHSLTDVVFVELPDVDETFGENDSMGVVESVKSVNDIFAPLAGKVVAVNEKLNDSPELMNDDCYGEGWFCQMQVDPAEYETLMDAAAYRKLIEHA